MKPKQKPQTSDRFIPYGKQSMDDSDLRAIQDVLFSDFLTTGPTVEKFEQEICNVTGAKHAVAVGNGTHALHLASLAADLKPGDWAVVPSITFLATANAVRYCGADVIFCDVDPMTGLMRPQDLQAAFDQNKDKNIRAVLPVHLRGDCVDLAPLKKMAEQKGVTMIADACHALGGSYQDTPAGACRYEDLATFSFHPVKTITTGEGGAITTNSESMARQMKMLRGHGMMRDESRSLWFYEMETIGFNYRLCDIQCALGVSQMKRLGHFIDRRRHLAALYDRALNQISPALTVPQSPSYGASAWHLYAVRIDFKALGKRRDDVMRELRARNIGTQVHYIPVHTQPYYTKLYGMQNLTGAQDYYEHTLSLPLYPTMHDDDVQRVADHLNDILNG